MDWYQEGWSSCTSLRCGVFRIVLTLLFKVWYRFNATLHSHASVRTALAKCTDLIECILNSFNGLGLGLELELKSEQFNKLKIIKQALICYRL